MNIDIPTVTIAIIFKHVGSKKQSCHTSKPCDAQERKARGWHFLLPCCPRISTPHYEIVELLSDLSPMKQEDIKGETRSDDDEIQT
eukprot:757658-Hanusia_phi.AAC.2